MTDVVFLQCVKEGSRLRMRITSPGYHHDANCQCPREIRVPGRKYTAPMHAITFVQGPNRRYFYRINKTYIKIVPETATAAAPGSRTPTVPPRQLLGFLKTLRWMIVLSA